MAQAPTAQERAGLRRIRRRRTVLLVYIAVGLVGVAVLASSRHADRYAMFAFALWLIGAIAPTLTVGLSRCPRCLRRFHGNDSQGNVFARACLNCGLRLDWP